MILCWSIIRSKGLLPLTWERSQRSMGHHKGLTQFQNCLRNTEPLNFLLLVARIPRKHQQREKTGTLDRVLKSHRVLDAAKIKQNHLKFMSHRTCLILSIKETFACETDHWSSAAAAANHLSPEGARRWSSMAAAWEPSANQGAVSVSPVTTEPPHSSALNPQTRRRPALIISLQGGSESKKTKGGVGGGRDWPLYFHQLPSDWRFQEYSFSC